MIAILGAGAVGCYYGGLLAASGQEVLFFAKSKRAKILQTEGLNIRWSTHTQHLKIQVTDDIQRIREANALLICVKANQSTAIANQIKPFLSTNTMVLSMQNGLQNAQRLSEVFGRPVDVAMIYAALAMTSDNTVSYQGGGHLVLGRPGDTAAHQDALQALADMFHKANIPVKISANITQDLWSKWIINCAFNALSALGQIAYQDLMQQAHLSEIINSIVNECFALAKAEKITLDEAAISHQIQQVAIQWPLQKSSMAQDVMAKRPTEIAELNGLAQAKGVLLNVPTPINTVLTSLIKMQERLY